MGMCLLCLRKAGYLQKKELDVKIPLCPFLTASSHVPRGCAATLLLCPSILCLLLAYFGCSSQNSPWVQFRCFDVKMNFLEKIYPSPESAAREQSPDLRQGSWRWLKLVANGHLGRMVHHTSWKNIKEIVRKKLKPLSSVTFSFFFYFSFDYDDHLKLTADFSPAWTDWGNPGGKTCLLPNSNYLQPSLNFDIWTLCQSLCNLLVRTVDLFLWNSMLRYHQPCFSLVPRNPGSLTAHGCSNWKTDSIGEKASKLQ